ncbi:uncharacterized protein FRV6_10700 [Fusarium oxysporum]|uniref:Uncharacterized protein n=1 Tax=Fusarium oxysporum TaxID=5507 RepID=A0A2H3TCX5_FUSOX|nr:uncharacterized protein FRV6_10700 [Fusarium oxysporum]
MTRITNGSGKLHSFKLCGYGHHVTWTALGLPHGLQSAVHFEVFSRVQLGYVLPVDQGAWASSI